MLIVISPAKRIDENSKLFEKHSAPRFPSETRELVSILKNYSPADLQNLMHINPQLADLNYARYQEFKQRHNRKNSLQALFAFNGDVFLGLNAKELSDEAVIFAQDHLRILSGLYGVLRPLDLMQAYRLEMGTKLANPHGKDLYAFWGDRINKQVRSDLRRSGDNILLNLASGEYFKALKERKIKARIITANFKEYVNGQLKFYPVFGKKARGLMTRYVLENKISDPEDLKGFNMENYYFEESKSSRNELLFVR